MVPAVLLISGITQLVVGVWTFVDPESFYDVVATYPPYNDHFLKDIGSWNIALGLAALHAARTPSWQKGMCGVLAVLYGLHALSHGIDLDQGEPRSASVATLVSQIVAAVIFAALYLRQARR